VLTFAALCYTLFRPASYLLANFVNPWPPDDKLTNGTSQLSSLDK
jgi:hypothetical protein